MKKRILLLIAFLSISSGFSQVALKKSSVSAGGGSGGGGYVYMVYALGELGVQEADAGTLHLSEGFVGPDITALLGVEDYAVLQGVNIYPNPVATYVNIDLPENGNYEIYLYDLTGKEIKHLNISDERQVSLNLSDLQSGVYVLGIVNHDNKQTVNFKVQKK